jgi:hypothetical protein
MIMISLDCLLITSCRRWLTVDSNLTEQRPVEQISDNRVPPVRRADHLSVDGT